MNQLLTETLENVIKSNKVSEYVFCHEDGTPYYGVRKAFDKALKEAEINNFRFHDSPHTFASHLVMVGIDLLTLKELLGHSSLEMTIRYVHLSPDFKKKAVNMLDGVFESSQPELTEFDLSSATPTATRRKMNC